MNYLEEQIAFNKMISQSKKGNEYKKCFFMNCKNDVIKAHSIQNNKILNKISTNGKVLSVTPNISENKLKPDLKKVGRNKASTFTGFCNKHDTNLFKAIELYDYEVGNQEQEFLYAYRALAKEYHIKQTVKNMYEKKISLTDEELMEIQEYCGLTKKINRKQVQEIVKPLLKGTNESIEKLKDLKISININLSKKRYHKIESRVIKLKKEYYIAVSSLFYILKDLKGNMVNNIKKFNNMKNTFLTIFPQNGCTYIIISFLKKHKNYFRFIDKQIMNKEEEQQKIIMSNMLGIYVENVFLSPERWENMTERQKNKYLKLLEMTMLDDPPYLLIDRNLNIFI